MAKIGRPGMSDEQKREVWRRWKEGQNLSEIARGLDRVPGVIHNVIASNGGVAPAARTRSARSLSLAEREEISRGLAAGESMRSISARLGRCASTISREFTRNGGRVHYRAGQADSRAWEKATRPKQYLLARRSEAPEVSCRSYTGCSSWLRAA